MWAVTFTLNNTQFCDAGDMNSSPITVIGAETETNVSFIVFFQDLEYLNTNMQLPVKNKQF